MNFLELEKSIIRATQEGMKQTLENDGLDDFDEYANDFVDFDEHTKPRTMFFDFDTFDISALSNESQDAKISLSIRMAFRKDKSSELKKQQLLYTSAFYNWFYGGGAGTFGHLADYGSINSVEFFDAVNGDTSIKLSEIKITLQKETSYD